MGKRYKKKLKLPYAKDQYVVDWENKIIYLIGSYMRAMALSIKREELTPPGFTIKLGTKEEVDQIRKEIKNA